MSILIIIFAVLFVIGLCSGDSDYAGNDDDSFDMEAFEKSIGYDREEEERRDREFQEQLWRRREDENW